MPARSLLTAGLAAVLGAAAGACGGGDAVPRQATPSRQFAGVTPVRTSATLAHDPDDPAIWVHPTAPERSLVLGTVKVAAPDGGVAVFGLDGALRQLVTGIDRPNNIDVEYGFTFGGQSIDIAVITERYQRRLRVFSIAPDGSGISDLGVVPVLEGQLGEAQAPMGIGIYRRPATAQPSPSFLRKPDRGRLPVAVPPAGWRRQVDGHLRAPLRPLQRHGRNRSGRGGRRGRPRLLRR